MPLMGNCAWLFPGFAQAEVLKGEESDIALDIVWTEFLDWI